MSTSINYKLSVQSLAFILHALSQWKKDHATLQAKYQYVDSTNTHFLLLQPSTIFQQNDFTEKITATILNFYELFPDEAIIIMEENKSNMVEDGVDILTQEGFQLSIELMNLLSSTLLQTSTAKETSMSKKLTPTLPKQARLSQHQQPTPPTHSPR